MVKVGIIPENRSLLQYFPRVYSVLLIAAADVVVSGPGKSAVLPSFPPPPPPNKIVTAAENYDVD